MPPWGVVERYQSAAVGCVCQWDIAPGLLSGCLISVYIILCGLEPRERSWYSLDCEYSLNPAICAPMPSNSTYLHGGSSLLIEEFADDGLELEEEVQKPHRWEL